MGGLTQGAVRVSVGVGVGQGVCVPAATLYANADANLYQAKNQGRDRFCF